MYWLDGINPDVYGKGYVKLTGCGFAASGTGALFGVIVSAEPPLEPLTGNPIGDTDCGDTVLEVPTLETVSGIASCIRLSDQ